jgi:hypothetical protein
MSSRKEEEDHIKERERQFRVTSGGNLAGASNISHKASEPGASFVESSPELLDMWSTGPGGQADGGPKNTREQMEKSIKDRERQFRTAMPGAVAVSEPDVSGSFTVPSTSSASSNIWGAKKTPSQAPSTASPERMSVREQEDERTKDRGRAARIGSLRGLGGEVNNVQVSEPDTSNEVAVSSAVSGASLNVWGHKSAPSVGNSASVPRSTSPTPSDSSNVWAKKTQTEAPSAAARASLPVSSKGPSTKELEDLAIKERERATRMYTVTTNPAGQARSFTSNQTPASEPDMPAASLTTSAVIHAPGAPKSEASSAIASMTAPQRDPIRILSINRSTEQEDEQIKDRERQFRTGTAASGPIVSTIRPDGGAVSGMNQSQTSLNSSFSASTMRAGKNETTTKGLVDEDEIIKARERQNRTAHVTGLTTLAGGNILTAGALQNAAPDVELVEVPAEMVFQSVVSEAYTANSIDRSAISSRDSTLPEKSRTGPRSLRGLVATGESTQPGVVRDDSAAEERIRAKSGRHATSVGNSNILTAGALQNEAPDVELVEVSPDMMFQSVVSEAYTANSVDRSAISSRDSTLPEKSRTGPRGLRGLGATAATGESTQPGVVRDDSAAEEMIRAKRGRHAASVGNSNMGTSTFDLAVKSETHGIPVSVPVESVGRADEEEYIPKGAFRVYGNGIIVQQQPGILSDQMPESVPEISAEMGASAFPPPDPEEPNDGPTSVSTAAYLVPDARKIDETDNEGKSEDLPFYKSRTFFALIGIIVLAAIAIGVGVALSGGGGGGGSDGEVASAPTAAPTEDPIYQARKVFFTNFLENEGMDVESLEDSSSSQNKAFNWILNDVEISRIAENSTDDEIQVALSRYVLAVFYYSLNGSTWIRDSGWLNATLGHCSWEFISCDGADLITNISTGSFIEYLVDSPDALQAALDHGGNNLEGILPSELKHFTSLGECIHVSSLSFICLQRTFKLTLFRVS